MAKKIVNCITKQRDWGKWEVIKVGEGFKVKFLQIKPGQQLSRQYHHHRSEHWAIVRGAAEILIDNEIALYSEGDSVIIDKMIVHQVENVGKIDLVIIETQLGSYLEEDDIVRLDEKINLKDLCQQNDSKLIH